MTLRAPTLADVPQIAAVMNELSLLLHGSGEVSEAELRLWFDATEAREDGVGDGCGTTPRERRDETSDDQRDERDWSIRRHR